MQEKSVSGIVDRDGKMETRSENEKDGKLSWESIEG